MSIKIRRCRNYTEENKIKIIYLLNTGRYSGAENVVIQIIKNLSAYREEYDLVYVSKEGMIRDYLSDKKIRFLPVKKMSPLEIRKIIRQERPDIIHANDFTASVAAAMSCLSIPIISHIHNNTPWLRNCNWKTIVYFLSCVRYRRILAVSPSVQKEFIFGRWISKKTDVIGNPVNVKEIQKKLIVADNKTEKKYQIAFLGRLSPEKNPMRFLDIIYELKKEEESVSAVMIGDGNLREQCEEKVRQLNLKNNIVMTGFLKNPYTYLQQCQILCMTSEWEGFGLAAIEALAFGIPVVAMAVGGLPLIVDDRCGKICRTNVEFVTEIFRLINDAEYYEEKRRGARLRALELDNIDDYIYKMDLLYREVLFL